MSGKCESLFKNFISLFLFDYSSSFRKKSICELKMLFLSSSSEALDIIFLGILY